jgi:ATP dependent DNA ligase domain
MHEVKHDGFRILALKQGERVQVWSRRGADLTYRFSAIAEAVRRTASMNAINPLSRKIGKRGKVLFHRQPLCLETADLARRGRAPNSRPAADIGRDEQAIRAYIRNQEKEALRRHFGKKTT